MKKRAFSIFLVLALLLAALAGCGQDNGSSRSDDDDGEEEEQLLAKGYYEVTDEDGDVVGYLKVTSSKITVYDKRGNEEDTLRYDYSARKELYTLDDGELFGSEEFTVEKSKKKLKLITEDDEYTLEEIDEDEIGGGGSKPAGGDAPGGEDPDYIELPLGCYAAYDGRSLAGYIKVERRTMTAYDYDGYLEEEYRYSYDRDGNCIMEDEYGEEAEYQFTYERGDYYMYYMGYMDEAIRLEPISESEIPVYGNSGGTTGNTTDILIGGNGSIDLYAWLPDELYDELNVVEDEDDSLTAVAQYYDYDAGVALIFSAVLASGDNLEDAVDAARGEYGNAYRSDADLLFSFLRDNFLLGGLDSGYISGVYLGDDMEYDVVEDDMTVNGRSWRYCDVYLSAEDGIAYISMMFWMDGDDMALVMIGGIVEDLDYSDDMYSTVYDIIYSLGLDT